MELSSNQTLDQLKRFGLSIIQPVDGYRFTLDPLLLCDFTRAEAEQQIVDLGTGSGVMALVLASMAPQAMVYGFEQSRSAAVLAEQNISLNKLDHRITILNEDILNLRKHLPVSCSDLVVSNPPYRQQGRGRLNPHPDKLSARHETTATLADFLAAAKYLVKPVTGRICMIYHTSRLAELLVLAASLKLSPLRLRLVHGLPEADAKVFLVELSKSRNNVDLEVLPPLIVRSDSDNYTDEVHRILTGFHP